MGEAISHKLVDDPTRSYTRILIRPIINFVKLADANCVLPFPLTNSLVVPTTNYTRIKISHTGNEYIFRTMLLLL